MFHVPGKYNGGEGPGYSWTQTQSEVELRAPLPAGAEGSVRCTFAARTLALSWANAAAPLDAELSALVAPDDCLWSVEEEGVAKIVVVSMRKQVKAVWSRLLTSDAEPAEPPRLIDGAERATPKSKAELLADAKQRAKGALNEELGKAKLHMVEGKSGEVIVLEAAAMPDLPVLFLKKCDGCEVTLPEGTSAIKVQFQGCKRCVLRVSGKVLTETLEVWECEGCRVEVGSKLATIQVDACSGLEINFVKLSFFDRVMSAGLRGGQLRFGDAPQRDVVVDFDAECAARPGEVLSEKTDQLITWRVGEGEAEQVLTELIIRLCNDFPTTEREVRGFEERTRMQHDKLDEVVDGMLGSSIGQNMTTAEREQMKTMFQLQATAASAAKVEAEQTAQGRHAARVVFRKNQGNEAFKENNYQQAAVHYTEALTLDESQHAIFSNRAACFLKLGRYQQAREDAEACTKLDPTFAKGHFRLALALQAEEKYGEACAAFGKVLELEPNNKDAKSGLGVAQMQAERERRAQAG